MRPGCRADALSALQESCGLPMPWARFLVSLSGRPGPAVLVVWPCSKDVCLMMERGKCLYMVRVFDRHLDENLHAFLLLLSQKGVMHRVAEERGRQVLWVPQQHLDETRALFADWQSGALQPGSEDAPPAPSARPGLLGDWQRIPCTLLLLVATLVVAGLTSLGDDLTRVTWFSPRPLLFENGTTFLVSFFYALQNGEYWRLVSPLFLHFGLFHLLFNMLWLLQLGHRLETRCRYWLLPALVLLTGVVSNLVQVVWSSPSTLFGGMSGVIYGLLGFCWQAERRRPDLGRLPVGLYLFMLVWLAAGWSPLPAALGLGELANGAHTGGLLAGLVTGWLFGGRNMTLHKELASWQGAQDENPDKVRRGQGRFRPDGEERES